MKSAKERLNKKEQGYMNLKSESETLFIPLLGKAMMSKEKVFLIDNKAEEIIDKIDYDFKKLKQSKWLSMYMSLRASIIDKLTNNYLDVHQNTTVIHLGCGLDSRCMRVKQNFYKWYDIDFKDVIDIRKEFYKESKVYEMISSSVTDYKWLDEIELNDNVLIVAEGLTMYLEQSEISELLEKISNKFKSVYLIFDAYSKRGVKLSKIKNPVNQMEAQIKYGFNNVEEFLMLNDKLEHLQTHLIKQKANNLKIMRKFIFNHLYCGKVSQSIYKIYEFKLNGSKNQ